MVVGKEEMNMKRKLAMVVVLAMVLAGCATTGQSTPQDVKVKGYYTSLLVAAETYNVTMTGLRLGLDRGLLTQADIAKVLPYAGIYYDAYQAGSVALYSYALVLTADAESKFLVALSQVTVALTELTKIAQPYLAKGM